MLEIYTDSCKQVESALSEPLPTLVSGAGAKWRPAHPTFIAEQERTYPEQTTVWSKGPTWGFMYVVLEGDVMRIEAVVPATDFSRQSRVEKVVTFPRRSP